MLKKQKLAYEDGRRKKWGEFDNTKKGGINQRVWMLPNKGKFLDVLDMHNYTNCVEAVLGKILFFQVIMQI